MTLLSEQLQKLSIPRDQVKGGTIQQSSLIFSTRVASDFDTQDIYDIGINGLEELIALNPVFSRFKDTLFHPISSKFERLVKTQDFLTEVDEEISAFLSLVCSYGVLSPAHKALEWLIRVYKIHLYNTNSLLAAFLPLHDTTIFSKLLEITSLSDEWMWLETAKKNNVGIGREDLVKLCVSNPHLFCSFLESSLRTIELTEGGTRVHHSFLVTLVFLVLEQFPEVPPEVTPKLFSCVSRAISSENKDVKSAGYIIIGQLSRKVCLKDHILEELLTALSTSSSSLLVRELVLCLACIAHHQPLTILPGPLLELLHKEEYTLAVTIVHSKNDITALIKLLVISSIDQVFAGPGSVETLESLLQLEGLSDPLAQSWVDHYMSLYVGGSQEVRDGGEVQKLGEILSNTFPDQVQDSFQGYHSKGLDMAVLEQLKSLILGKYLQNETSQKLMEISHDLPGIRMLGLLKISEKLHSGTQLSGEENREICAGIVERITDPDDQVSLKSLQLVKQFLDEDEVLESVLKAVQTKVGSWVGDKTRSGVTGVGLVTALIETLGRGAAVMGHLIVVLGNVVGVLDNHFTKQISVQLRSVPDMKKLSKAVVGAEWDTTFLDFITQLADRAAVVRLLCKHPSPENFKLVCALGGVVSGEELDTVCSYLLDILNTAVRRKFEYKEMVITDANFAEVLAKAPKFYSNFCLMKREWECVGLVLSVFTRLAPRISSLTSTRDILLYSVRASGLQPQPKPLLAILDKATVYRVAMQVLLNDNSVEVLADQGLPDGLEPLLECVRQVKLAEQDVAIVLPYLLCSLLASEEVRSWSYKRLKTLSKLEGSTSPSLLVLKKLKLNKNMSLQQLQQGLAGLCTAEEALVATWLDTVLPFCIELPQLYQILASVHHPAKLRHCLRKIQGGAVSTAILGDLAAKSAELILADSQLLDLLFSSLRLNPGMVADGISVEFLGGLGAVSGARVVKELLEQCRVGTLEEHTKLAIRQKLSELSGETTISELLSTLKNTSAFNSNSLLVLNTMGAASVELATTLFNLLPNQPGSEEDIVTLLSSVCGKLGKETPLTPTALRGVVDVIRHTNKQTHRHALHQGCIVLLSKLAIHFPSLVLDHVIEIFTFMGDSTMRLDDSYSIQVLMEAIETIVPVIKQRQDMVRTLRVFCDTLAHIPSHRADPIFSLLLQTCGHKHLYHVFVFAIERCSRERELASQFSHFLQGLALHFGLSELLDTTVSLINTLAKLPEKLDKMTGKTYKVRLDSGLELNFNDTKHFNYFKLGLATQLFLITTNKHFTGILSAFESNVGEEKKLAELIELALSIMIHYQDKEGDKFVEMLNKRLTGVTTSVTGGLPSTLFISVVRALLDTNTALLHSKSLTILLNRIKGESGWTEEFEGSIVSLIDTLLKLTRSQELTWKVLALLVKKIGAKYPDDFLKVLHAAIEQIPTTTKAASVELRAYTSNCVTALGVRIVGVLPDLVRVLTLAVQDNVEVLGVVVSTVPQFMSPYIGDILSALSAGYTEDMGKLTKEIGTGIKLRVLLPAILTTTDNLLNAPYHNLTAVTDTLSHAITSNVTHDIKTQVQPITALFTKLLSYRDETTKYEQGTEDGVITCSLCLVYKLTEKEFLPLLNQLLQWSSDSVERATTFYSLTTQLSDKLQGLFLLFGGSIFVNIVDKLKDCKPIETSQELENKKRKVASSGELLKYLLRTLYNMLKFDTSHAFLTSDRFETLLPLLLDLVSLPDIADLTPVLSYLPIAANSERLWKQFNFQLLNLSKSHDSKVRQNVVMIYSEFVTKLAQDYTSLLPDSLPFLAEILEDSDTKVEEAAHLLVKTIEQVTGESMDKYL